MSKTQFGIRYGKRTEAEIQAELYHQVKLAGLDARLEVKAVYPDGRICRLDLVVFSSSRQPICVVECKKSTSVKKGCGGHRQIEKYKELGLPVFLCCRNDIASTLELIKEACAFHQRRR